MLVTEDNSLSENELSCYVSMEYNITFPIYQMFGENKSKKVVIEVCKMIGKWSVVIEKIF